ncbi:MAG: hypothetical protein C4534_02395 [Gaiellales bacterium]|nr:MAG: hypothetical protein C4534_02395 [Gaiellales bacterium]
MMPEYYQTCICCDDPIEVHGFILHVCESCRRETEGSGDTEEPVIACCLYEAESLDETGLLGAR